jgi:hypothetical protein
MRNDGAFYGAVLIAMVLLGIFKPTLLLVVAAVVAVVALAPWAFLALIWALALAFEHPVVACVAIWIGASGLINWLGGK